MSTGVTVVQYATHTVAKNPTGSVNPPQGFLNRVSKATPTNFYPTNQFYELTDLIVP